MTHKPKNYQKTKWGTFILFTIYEKTIDFTNCFNLELIKEILSKIATFPALAELKEKVEAEGFDINVYNVDVADRESVYKHAALIKDEVGSPVDILINNAGIVCGQTLLDIPDSMIEKTFKVNIISHYWVCFYFLTTLTISLRCWFVDC